MNDVCDCVYSVCEWTYERRPDIRERNLLSLFSILLNWFFGNFMYVHKTFLSPLSVKHLPLISTSCIILYHHQVCMLLPHLFICFLFNLALTEFTQGNFWGHECDLFTTSWANHHCPGPWGEWLPLPHDPWLLFNLLRSLEAYDSSPMDDCLGFRQYKLDMDNYSCWGFIHAMPCHVFKTFHRLSPSSES